MAENTESHPAPLWAWLLGLLPWVWIVPFNQYFWDDWLTAPLTGWDEQLARWEGGAKHYLNPVMYFLLLPLGQWVFHILMLVGTIVAAMSLSRIAAHLRAIPRSVSTWAGPMLLAVPVFHSRFSAAVLEYVLAIAAFLSAWAIMINPRRSHLRLISIMLIGYAIGVPSLAVLFPVAWIHTTLESAKSMSRPDLVKSSLRNSHFLVVPLIYFVIFRTLLNTKSRYETSTGALTEFGRGLGVLVVVIAIALVFVWWSERQSFRNYVWIAGFLLGVYFGLFPYFAVGYNPLSDFLPWRMRGEILDAAPLRIATTFVMLSALGLCVSAVLATTKSAHQIRVFSIPTFLAAGFGSTVIVLGPMDWESRHWLVSWPAMALLCLMIVGLSKSRDTALRSVFVTLVVASLVISSEYLVDSLKQKALVQSSKAELKDVIPTIAANEATIVIAIELTNDGQRLNARNRMYRPYEWWGILSSGLGIPPESLRVMEIEDVESQETHNCKTPFRATLVTPSVLTTRVEALTRLRVKTELKPKPIRLCSIAIKHGYPRDSEIAGDS